jgi:transmembrane sensor
MKSIPPRPDPAAEEAAALWATRLDEANLSAADQITLDTWLAADPAHRTLLSEYCALSADLERRLPLVPGIKDQLSAIPSARPSSPWRWPVWGGLIVTAAACALILVAVRPRTRIETFATLAAHRQELALADGSRVELNAQTSLEFTSDGHERRARMASGEAFFVVQKDVTRPFILTTPTGSVQVTGTQFNVRAETGGAFEVTVVEGSVKVRPRVESAESAAAVLLGAGQQLTSGSAGVEVRALPAASVEEAIAWRHGQIVFDGVPLQEALARFARYHGRSLAATPAAAGLRVGGRFSLDDPDGFFVALEEVLPVRVNRGPRGSVQVSLRTEK